VVANNSHKAFPMDQGSDTGSMRADKTFEIENASGIFISIQFPSNLLMIVSLPHEYGQY